MKRALAGLGCIALVSLIFFDSLFHFDADLIALKRKHTSAQRHWNLFYGQQYVYYDSSMRYQKDFAQIAKLTEPGFAVLSDLATSYYAASELPIYPFNIHRHHGRRTLGTRSNLISNQHVCYMSHPERLSVLKSELVRDYELAERMNWPEWRYILINNDRENLNLRSDCLWHGRFGMRRTMSAIADLIYEGEYLSLYQIRLPEN